MIGWLRRVLRSMLAGGPEPSSPAATRSHEQELDRRLEAARKRLKETIPPPEGE